jgi:hypothetical protein
MRSTMSQRTHEASIVQPTLPLGDLNPLSSATSRSAASRRSAMARCRRAPSAQRPGHTSHRSRTGPSPPPPL